MNRDELRHVLRAVAAHTGVTELVVIGSQAVLGTTEADLLPSAATRSQEVDVAVDPVLLAPVRPDLVAQDVADEVDGAFGEYSQFHASFGYYAQGVEVSTAVLPAGWRGRLRQLPFDEAHGRPLGVAHCLDLHDLWVSKAAAGREKDLEFCRALALEGWVDEPVCRERGASLGDLHRAALEMALAWSFAP